MALNRELQRRILEYLTSIYPNHAVNNNVSAKYFVDLFDAEWEDLYREIFYLQEHGLVEWLPRQQANSREMLRATHKGADFVANDGGLSAILGVVTIKVHDDTLKSLVEAKILQSDLPQPEQQKWIAQLRSLPAETTKHLLLKLLDLGLEKGPAALALLGTYLGSAT